MNVFPSPPEFHVCEGADAHVWSATFDGVIRRWDLDDDLAWEIADRAAELFNERASFWMMTHGTVERFSTHLLARLFGDLVR